MKRGLLHRLTPLRTAALQNQYSVSEAVLVSTARCLRTFRSAAEDHEGIVFWGGIKNANRTAFTTLAVPRAYHDQGRVFVDEVGVAEVVLQFHRLGVGLLAQVHSHPGSDARHSDGDDQMILMPYEGMLSIVVPWYAAFGMQPITMCGIHQLQNATWTLCTSQLDNMTIVPTVIDVR